MGIACKVAGHNWADAPARFGELVLRLDTGWDTPMVAGLITEPGIASDPKVVEAVRRVEKASVEYDNAMITLVSGIGRSG